MSLDPAAVAQTFAADETQPVYLRELASLGDTRLYRKNTILIHEADVGDTLFIVMSGRVKVFCTDASDKEITFGVFGVGEYFGEMALDGGPRSASVVTQEACVCALVTRTALLAYIAKRPEFALLLLSKVIHRLRMATSSARSLAFIDVYGRLTTCLLGLAKPQPDGTQRIEERITHQEIASRAGCSREMVSRILKDLENGGYLRMLDRRIVLVRKLPRHW
jgi:CRP/FNR family transcriptional regulator, cyclic AMP receptor protein